MIYDISFEAAGSGLSTNSHIQNSAHAHGGEQLLLELKPILDGLSAKFSKGDPHLRADLSQEGVVAVLSAMQRFAPKRGSLARYAARCAKGAMQNHRRWLRKFDKEISESCFLPQDHDDEFASGWDFIPFDTSAVERMIGEIDAAWVKKLTASVLTAKERSAVVAVYYDGLLAGEAATSIGVSAPRVTQLLQSALSKLRKHLKFSVIEQN